MLQLVKLQALLSLRTMELAAQLLSALALLGQQQMMSVLLTAPAALALPQKRSKLQQQQQQHRMTWDRDCQQAAPIKSKQHQLLLLLLGHVPNGGVPRSMLLMVEALGRGRARGQRWGAGQGSSRATKLPYAACAVLRCCCLTW